MQFSGLFNVNGIYMWCEVQLNLTRMIALKSGTAQGQVGGGPVAHGAPKRAKSGHDAFDLARAINAFAAESFLHVGDWNSAVAEQVKAGLLLEVDLRATRGVGIDPTEMLSAFSSKQCRVRKLDVSMVPGLQNLVGLILSGNVSLVTVAMNECDLGETGGLAIADALKTNLESSLVSIGLGNNAIGDVAGAAIAGALEKNMTVTRLNMINNNLGPLTGAALLKTLKMDKTLTSIKLMGNSMSFNVNVNSIPQLEVIEAAMIENRHGDSAKGDSSVDVATSGKSMLSNAILDALNKNGSGKDTKPGCQTQ